VGGPRFRGPLRLHGTAEATLGAQTGMRQERLDTLDTSPEARSGATSRVVLVALLLGVALAGCGASQATTAQATRAGAPPASSTLATELERAQAVIDDKSASASDLQKAARSQQLAFRQLVLHRGLRRATLARLSPAAHAAALSALHASDALSTITPAEPRFPHWRIIAPPPPTKLLGYFRAAGAAYGIPWRYLAAIELVETRMGRIRGLSPAGAQGPMQFMPATWAEYGKGSIDSQRDSIMAAARYLAASGGRSDIAGALFHYNPSKSYVAAVESYAREMRRDERAFRGYYYWQVFYRTTKGTFLLPVGYPRVRPEPLPGA
jgi:membrane-bound lytic murein transglycosylase B